MATLTVGDGALLVKLFTVMDTFPGQKDVQRHACAALAALAKTRADQEKIVAMGGIRRLLTAMDAHTMCAGGQQGACIALGKLGHLASAEDNVQARLRTVMSTHRRNGIVRRVVKMALKTISENSSPPSSSLPSVPADPLCGSTSVVEE